MFCIAFYRPVILLLFVYFCVFSPGPAEKFARLKLARFRAFPMKRLRVAKLKLPLVVE